jgi:hypothetical protein
LHTVDGHDVTEYDHDLVSLSVSLSAPPVAGSLRLSLPVVSERGER